MKDHKKEVVKGIKSTKIATLYARTEQNIPTTGILHSQHTSRVNKYRKLKKIRFGRKLER